MLETKILQKCLKSLIQKKSAKYYAQKIIKKSKQCHFYVVLPSAPLSWAYSSNKLSLELPAAETWEQTEKVLLKTTKICSLKLNFKKILRKLDYLNIMSSGSPNESTASRLERIGRRSDANDRQEIDSDFVEENIGKFYFQ